MNESMGENIKVGLKYDGVARTVLMCIKTRTSGGLL
jgi:hypothetical protein